MFRNHRLLHTFWWQPVSSFYLSELFKFPLSWQSAGKPDGVFEKHNMLNKSDNSSDIALIKRILEGDTDAFEIVMKEHSPFVLRIVKRHVPENDIEDVAQNAFLRIYQSLKLFKGKGSLKSWLSTVTVRTCYDYWRKAYQSRDIPMNSLSEKQQEWLENTISNESETELYERGKQKEASELLEWALYRLSAEDRIVMELIYLEGYTCKEVSENLGWSVSNVKVRSFRLKKKLKAILEGAKKEPGRRWKNNGTKRT